jgi:hypothetical protein
VTRFKIMASLDISERRRPQDGKIRTRLSGRELELRVSTIPSVRGNEDLVLRLLAPEDLIPIEAQGFNERNFLELKRLIVAPTACPRGTDRFRQDDDSRAAQGHQQPGAKDLTAGIRRGDAEGSARCRSGRRSGSLCTIMRVLREILT